MYLLYVNMWIVKYYKDLEGNCEVKEFIENLKTKQQGKVLAWIDMLKKEGPALPRPFADLLRDGIHELRIKISGNQMRVLYFFIFQNYIILTHAIRKKQSKVPEKEINKAKKMKDDFNSKFKNKRQFEQFLKEYRDD